MKEILELVMRDSNTMIVSIILLVILTGFIFRVLNSFFVNAFGQRKIKKVKIYVDEDGDEIVMD